MRQLPSAPRTALDRLPLGDKSPILAVDSRFLPASAK